jgi:hypothetical protein
MGKDWYRGCVNDQEWRLNHLYFINTKSQGVIRFKMNWAQAELYHGLHTRTTILKARQLGMSTFTSLYMLDNCLFNKSFNGGIIDQKADDAEEKMAKIRLAYECMQDQPQNEYDHVEDPEDRRAIAMFAQAMTDKTRGGVKADINKAYATFSNGSTIRSGLSLRGGTIHFLHISEYGPIAAKDPARAIEIKNGGFNTVPDDGCIIIESTHEGGRRGENYRILKAAMENQGKELSALEWKFFFFPWWKQKEYRAKSNRPLDVGHLREYFEGLEAQGIMLDDEQKRWYCIQEKSLDTGIKTEFPSTAEEALMGETRGSIYGSILMRLRKEGRVGAEFEVEPFYKLFVSWDIGMQDYTCMWLWQVGGDGKYYAVDYYCSHNKDFMHYVEKVRSWERTYGATMVHLLPHDAKQRSFETGLPRFLAFDKAFGANSFRLIPRVNMTWEGIDAFKLLLKRAVFHKRCGVTIHDDETGDDYMSGMDSLENYRVNAHTGEPQHDEASHGADAARMFAEAEAAGYIGREGVSFVGKEGDISERKKRKSKRAKGLPSGW